LGGARISGGSFLVLLIEAHLAAGQAEAGLVVVAEALDLAQETGAKYEEAEIHRLKGEFLLDPPGAEPTQAEACFHHALSVARRDGARSWELRAAVSLARLWQRQGKWAEARDLLAPIYGRFREGFDTQDLREARALLEQVSRS
jgi:predicted ATPase